jgi:manganese/iron transport system ATP-binding protein
VAILREIEKTDHAIRRQHAEHHLDRPILEVRDLSVHYPGGDALSGVSFTVPRAMRLAVVGSNGAGKSTLLKVIAGVITPSQGTVQVFGEEPGAHICIGYVPQRSQVDWNFPVSVRDVVMMGRASKLGLLRRPSRADWEIVDQALSVVNLNALAKRQISELSGGQQQRMFIARTLAQEAELMLMDEPLTGLDVSAREDLLHIFDLMRERRVTVLVALHDLNLAAERFDAILLLKHRLLGMGSPEQVFTPANLAEAYGDRHSHEYSMDNNLPMDDACCASEDHDHA